MQASQGRIEQKQDNFERDEVPVNQRFLGRWHSHLCVSLFAPFTRKFLLSLGFLYYYLARVLLSRHSQSLLVTTVAAAAADTASGNNISQTSGSGSANVWIALNHFLHWRCRHRRRCRRLHRTGKELPYASEAKRKWSDLMVSKVWSFPPVGGCFFVLSFFSYRFSIHVSRSESSVSSFVVSRLKAGKITCNKLRAAGFSVGPVQCRILLSRLFLVL